MAYRIANRRRETTSSTGTGDLTLAGAVPGHATIASIPGIAGSDSLHYCAVAANGQWEVGLGYFMTAPNRIWRNTVIDGSSGLGITVNFTQAPEVFVTSLAEDLVTRSLQSSRFRDVSNQVIGAGLNVAIQFNGQGDYDLTTNGEYAYNTANWRWDTLSTGFYDVLARVEAATTFAGDSYLVAFQNGVEKHRGPVVTDGKTLSLACRLKVPANQHFDVRLFTTTGGSVAFGAAKSWAQAFWVSR